jgi:hypothetical protein
MLLPSAKTLRASPLRDQWRQLILHPLSKLDCNACQCLYVLIVDALDECEDEVCEVPGEDKLQHHYYTTEYLTLGSVKLNEINSYAVPLGHLIRIGSLT